MNHYPFNIICTSVFTDGRRLHLTRADASTFRYNIYILTVRPIYMRRLRLLNITYN